ncbi:hypothetical protein HLB23_28350 [Nocardia uniformis]|uniref:Uncharacterized protein n=1 Tax=Nocardia uniformis TaxID=53432 RepID=A0A849CEE7_9NOCA|nr:hypothetical protein [Nocardia uniformis]NNH73719.1 hypothetical protein [Nocardia uniformis]
MQSYTFQLGTDPWPEAVTLLQFYAPVDLSLPANHELAELISRWRAAVLDEPITLLDSDYLHVTLECVTDRVAADIPAGERAGLVEAVHRALDGVPAYLGRAGSCYCYRSGPLIDVSPAAPLTTDIHRRLRGAVQSVRGPDSTAFPVSKAHVSLGYGTATTDSDPINKKLRQIDPAGAPLYLPRVELVEVAIDQAAGQLTWETLESFPLGPALRSDT